MVEKVIKLGLETQFASLKNYVTGQCSGLRTDTNFEESCQSFQSDLRDLSQERDQLKTTLHQISDSLQDKLKKSIRLQQGLSEIAKAVDNSMQADNSVANALIVAFKELLGFIYPKVEIDGEGNLLLDPSQ